MAKKKTDFFANVQNRQQENMREIEINQSPSLEEEQMVGMSMRVPAELRRRMRQHYAQTGESMNALIIRLVEEELNKH